MVTRIVLLDANVVAAYFAPTTANAKVTKRIKTLLDGVGTGGRLVFMMPDFSVAEVFGVFEKYRWGTHWVPSLKTKPGVRMKPKEFDETRERFRKAIHNGSRINQYHLNRYHILCTDLLTPINAAYQIDRAGSNKGKSNARPAGSVDMLILAMAMWLSKQFGRDEVVLVTADNRLAKVARRAASAKLGKEKKAHLIDVAKDLGMTYSPDVYPRVLNIGSCKKTELDGEFPAWTPSW